MAMLPHVLHQGIAGIIKGVLYDQFERTAKTSINRFYKITEVANFPCQCSGIIRRMALLNGSKKFRCIRPGQRHVGRASRPAVKPNLPAVDGDRPFKVPVFKNPQRFNARFTDVLAYGTVAARQDKSLLYQSPCCTF